MYGDPSWDAFRHSPGNPVHRGSAGLEWPVNGFLFRDPVSSDWYAYIGNYPARYEHGQGKSSICTVSRSRDRGGSWEHLGPVFPEVPFFFDGFSSRVAYAPDVTVACADGLYHMVYDWATEDSSWQNVRSYRSGFAYAWSERPEGPFHRCPTPLFHNGLIPKDGIFRRYDRCYASSLVRRRSDWLILTLIDAGHHYAWGLVAFTSDNPRGPYSGPEPVLHVESNRFHPPLMEYFPAFTHDGWVYAPATSVALNRNFQIVHRAPVEKATDPDAWELFQHGSVWHAADKEHEAAGIWGQTFSGFVDDREHFQVLFPSKDSNDIGTINFASRPWTEQYAPRGFRISGHKGPSLALLLRTCDAFALDCTFTLTGSATLFWGNNAPLGADRPASDSSLHELSSPGGSGLQFLENSWRLLDLTRPRTPLVLASGPLSQQSERTLTLGRSADGSAFIVIDGDRLWEGALPAEAGSLGFLVAQDTRLSVERFVVDGCPSHGGYTLLHTEALLGAGQGLAGWDEVSSPMFRYGVGAVHKADGGRGKWNFFGTGFRLWLPRGPEYGTVRVLVDGRPAGQPALRRKTPSPSQPVLTVENLPEGFHAVVLTAGRGLVLDSIDVACSTLDRFPAQGTWGARGDQPHAAPPPPAG